MFLADAACSEETLVDGKWFREIEDETAAIAAKVDSLIAGLRARPENRS